MTDRQHRLANLSPQKRALVEQRMRQRELTAASAPAIPRRQRMGPCLASFSQQRLWLVDQLTPGTPAYNVPYALELSGEIDVPALGQALEAIVERHEVLRTVYASAAGRVVQIVLPKWPAILRFVDLSDRPSQERDRECERLLQTEAAGPFCLRRDVKLRCTLVRVDVHRFIFMHVSHHIAWDYRSREVFYQELAEFFEGFASARPVALPPLAIQYTDFAVWQRRRLQGAEFERLTDYWKARLAAAPPALNLPTDFLRPGVQSLRGARHFFVLSSDLQIGAQALSRKCGVTLFMTLLAAFYVFLHELTRATAISVGSPVAGRDLAETDPLIGFFINTLVLHVRLSGDLTFRELLERVRETVLGALAHQEMPFDKLVEVLKPPRDLSRNPLFQVNFRVAGSIPPSLRLPHVSIRPMDVMDTDISKFDLALELNPSAGGRSYCEYSTDLFTEATVARMCRKYEQVLTRALSRPDALLRDFEAGDPQMGGRTAYPSEFPSIRRERTNPPSKI